MCKYVRRLGALCLAALLLAGCGSEAVRPPPAELKPFTAVDRLDEVWSADIGSDIGKLQLRLEPVVVEDRILAVSRDGELSVLEVASGRALWNLDLDEPLLAGVSTDGVNAFVTTRAGELIAISLADQKVAWRTSLPSEVVTRPGVGGGRVYVYVINGNVMAFDARTGQRVWQQQVTEPNLTLRGTAPPVWSAGRVYVATSSGRVQALDADTGAVIWSTPVAEPTGRTLLDRLVDVDGGLSLHRGVLTALGYQGNLIQIEMASGRKLWNTPASGYTTPAVTDDLLVITEDNGDVRAWNNRTGELLWHTSELAWRDLSAPVIWRGRVVVGDFEGYLHVLDAGNGQLRGRLKVDSAAVRVRPQMVEEDLLVQTQGGDLIRITLENDDA
ncbi:MAG: outer membrane protein assembly factor BamB [Gammaproteobacteria bacterium]|nr:MAG: outer membrane protein assembly factor BamB [Gammaproteobacteria bacterium]